MRALPLLAVLLLLPTVAATPDGEDALEYPRCDWLFVTIPPQVAPGCLFPLPIEEAIDVCVDALHVFTDRFAFVYVDERATCGAVAALLPEITSECPETGLGPLPEEPTCTSLDAASDDCEILVAGLMKRPPFVDADVRPECLPIEAAVA